MPRFGRRNEIHARAQKSINLDKKLREVIGKNLKDGERFDDAANRYIALGAVYEDNLTPEMKIHRNNRLRKRLNIDEYLIVEMREKQQHHESYSDTVNRYIWAGIAYEAKHRE